MHLLVGCETGFIMVKKTDQHSDILFLQLFFSSGSRVTDEEVAYFREHPDQIEEVTAPVKIHKLFLCGGALLGTAFIGISKAFNYLGMLAFLSEGVREFVVDIVFEMGAALIGAAITVYVLGILLNKQRENAAKWRAEIRRRVAEQHEPLD